MSAMGFLPIVNLTRNRLLLGEKWPLRIRTCRAFNRNNLARHQVVSYVFECDDYCGAGDLRNEVLQANKLLTKWSSNPQNFRTVRFEEKIS